MVDSPIPTPPVPPMRPKARDLMYGVWAWLGVLILTASAGWSVYGQLPRWSMAVMLAHTAFGTYTGFLAKNYVSH